jgi:aminoglycoside phosphotransferase (APT) family kinase protein
MLVGMPDAADWQLTDGEVCLRAFEPEDAPALVAGRDEEWARWLGPGHPDPQPTACIVVREEIVGWVDADPAAPELRPGEVNLGYHVFAPHRGRGYATRALLLMLRRLAAASGHHTATLSIDRGNAASLEVATKAGFTHTGGNDEAHLLARPVVAATLAQVATPALQVADVRAFLSDLHGAEVDEVESLAGGSWSSAYGYRVEDRQLVLRLGTVGEGFEMDRDAMRFDGPDLPVPEVLDVGQALGCSYAVSVRHHGRFLEDVGPEEADVLGSTLVRLLDALRSLPADPGRAGIATGEERSWHGWLLGALMDDPSRRVSGWRSRIRADADLDRLLGACEHRIQDLLPACPERGDVVHGDLLHRNVLVSEDARRVHAVFSWRCSTRGDFLYDTAWCTFWSAWHPGVAAANVWDRMIDSSRRRGAHGDLTDAAARHHCYELQVGASHLAWNAWTGDDRELRAVAARTAHLLERGPLPMPDERR